MRVRVGTAAAVAVLLAVVGNSSAAASGASQGTAGDSRGNKTFTFAVIGDIPYGDAQIAAFPGRVDQLNADPDVQLVTHLGDIKSGSSLCSDEYFGWVRTQFDRFADPLIYTPGDNEWTDCHRANNGGYNPLERLAAIRSLFFANPEVTLGQHPMKVTSQASYGTPENVSFERSRTAFAAVHIVGSNNSLAPWTGNIGPTPEQTSEVLTRTAADIQLIRDTFDQARKHRDRAVVLFTQADMFDPTVAAPAYADYFAFQPLVQAIAQEANQFNGPVYLFNGDSHIDNQDQPLATGSPWPAFYSVTSPVDNLTRITVEGSTADDEWLKVTVDKQNPAALSVQRMTFS